MNSNYDIFYENQGFIYLLVNEAQKMELNDLKLQSLRDRLPDA